MVPYKVTIVKNSLFFQVFFFTYVRACPLRLLRTKAYLFPVGLRPAGKRRLWFNKEIFKDSKAEMNIEIINKKEKKDEDLPWKNLWGKLAKY